MNHIRCPECRGIMKVKREGLEDPSTYKRSIRKTKGFVKDETTGKMVRIVKCQKFVWTKIPKSPLYVIRFACRNPEHKAVIATGKSKADAHKAVNRMARRQS